MIVACDSTEELESERDQLQAQVVELEGKLARLRSAHDLTSGLLTGAGKRIAKLEDGLRSLRDGLWMALSDPEDAVQALRADIDELLGEPPKPADDGAQP